MKVHTSDVGQRARRRIALRLLPFVFVMYVICYVDRVNVSFANLRMSADLGFETKIRPALKKISLSVLQKLSGLSRRALIDARTGKSRPYPENQVVLSNIVQNKILLSPESEGRGSDRENTWFIE